MCEDYQNGTQDIKWTNAVGEMALIESLGTGLPQPSICKTKTISEKHNKRKQNKLWCVCTENSKARSKELWCLQSVWSHFAKS